MQFAPSPNRTSNTVTFSNASHTGPRALPTLHQLTCGNPGRRSITILLHRLSLAVAFPVRSRCLGDSNILKLYTLAVTVSSQSRDSVHLSALVLLLIVAYCSPVFCRQLLLATYDVDHEERKPVFPLGLSEHLQGTGNLCLNISLGLLNRLRRCSMRSSATSSFCRMASQNEWRSQRLRFFDPARPSRLLKSIHPPMKTPIV